MHGSWWAKTWHGQIEFWVEFGFKNPQSWDNSGSCALVSCRHFWRFFSLHEESKFVFATMSIASAARSSCGRLENFARICGRLQFDIKRDRGRGAHVVARLEPGCQIGITRCCCRQGKIAEEGTVFQGVKKMAPAYKICPPSSSSMKPASISPNAFPHVRLSDLPEIWKLTHMCADRRAHTHSLSCTNSLLVT